MFAEIDAARNEATYTYRLVEDVAASCKFEHEHQTYLAASEDFLEYINGSADASKSYIEDHLASVQSHPQYAKELRLAFPAIKAFWAQIHNKVRPAADAHTLALPVPLIRYAESLIQRIEGLERTEIVVFITSDLNYYNYDNANFTSLSGQLSASAKGAPPFPEARALIGIPYSQANRLFSNLTIFHELGHFVYARKSVSESVRPEISRILAKNFAPLNCEPGEEEATLEANSWLIEVVERWCQEVFCDLFAATIVGPSYYLALIQLVNVIGSTQPDQARYFYPTHPANLLRLHELTTLLTKLGWSQFVNKTLVTLLDLPDAEVRGNAGNYRFDLGNKDLKSIIPSFFEILPLIRQLVNSITAGIIATPSSAEKWLIPVSKCLSHAIPPSALIYSGDKDITESDIINCGYAFVLGGMEDLIPILRATEGSVGASAFALGRVEQWLLKSLEDRMLVTACPGDD